MESQLKRSQLFSQKAVRIFLVEEWRLDQWIASHAITSHSGQFRLFGHDVEKHGAPCAARNTRVLLRFRCICGVPLYHERRVL